MTFGTNTFGSAGFGWNASVHAGAAAAQVFADIGAVVGLAGDAAMHGSGVVERVGARGEPYSTLGRGVAAARRLATDFFNPGGPGRVDTTADVARAYPGGEASYGVPPVYVGTPSLAASIEVVASRAAHVVQGAYDEAVQGAARVHRPAGSAPEAVPLSGETRARLAQVVRDMVAPTRELQAWYHRQGVPIDAPRLMAPVGERVAAERARAVVLAPAAAV